jgi:hypothetical protein
LVHDQRRDIVRIAAILDPGKPMNQRFVDGRSIGSLGARRLGSGSSTYTDWPGLMPRHGGPDRRRVELHLVVIAAFVSDAMLLHQRQALSKSSPSGANRRPRR